MRLLMVQLRLLMVRLLPPARPTYKLLKPFTGLTLEFFGKKPNSEAQALYEDFEL